MYNNNNNNNNNKSSDHKQHIIGAAATPTNMNMSPRISFSNDFVESSSSNTRHQHLMNLQAATRMPSDVPTSDFEFSVSNYSMMSADELFSQGRLLPFKNSHKTAVTLREELLTSGDDDDDNGPPNGTSSSGVGMNMMRPPKGASSSGRWKGLLGLRKSHHVGSRKSNREDQPQPSTQHFTGNED